MQRQPQDGLEPEIAMNAADNNPLLQTWTAPFAAPPFAAIKPEHFGPAIEADRKSVV